MLRNSLILVGVLVGLGLAQSGFTLQSSAFKQGGTIPAKYTCTSEQSPPLTFLNRPKGTKSVAILGWDDDARGGLASQWVLYDLPPDTKGLPEGVAQGATGSSFKQGKNTYGKLGYTGPCSKDGKTHHIYFDLYALDVPSLGLPAGASQQAVHAQIKKHKIQEAKLMGLVR